MFTALEKYFSAEDLAEIQKAVGEVEESTSGEIVPYVVLQSDGYEGTPWRGALMFAFAASLLADGLHQLGRFWGLEGYLWIGLPPLLGGALGYAATMWIPWLRRSLIPREVMDRRVTRRAAVAFLEEEVFATRERTGILIFLSLFEHQVHVMGDSAINARVADEEWEEIVSNIAEGIRSGRAKEALMESLAKCGELLERRRVVRRPDDRNELSDHLRTRVR